MKDRLNSFEENILFTENLATISKTLDEAGIKYSLVGGLAIKAIMGEQVQARRPNSTIADFDALAIGPNSEAIKRVVGEIKTKREGKQIFPEIGIESAFFSDKPLP